MTRTRRASAVALALLLALAPAGAVLAVPAEGSVPAEVARYVADGSLVAQLNDVYGPDAGGGGIDFDETTKPGAIERVHVFSAAFRAGEDTDHPLDIVNQWVVPITIAEQPVGLATIWINPASVLPDLASFVADPELAAALTGVPDGSSLVHDEVSAAWLALAADGTLTPLVPGTTGLSTPVPIDDIALLPAPSPAPATPGDPNTGAGFAIAVILLLLAVVVVALVVPGLRRKRDDGDAEESAEEPASPEDAGPARAEEAPDEAEPEPEQAEPEAAEPAAEPATATSGTKKGKKKGKKKPPATEGDGPALP